MKRERIAIRIPKVWDEAFDENYVAEMRLEAAKHFRLNTLPDTVGAWKKERPVLKEALLEAIRFEMDRSLPLNVRITGTVRRKGYKITKLYYQAAQRRYVTANLYEPEGKGPFPAVINVHGHWPEGHLAERVQMRGHILAQCGYVCLTVDAFGSGERSDEHCKFLPHGGYRGGLLLNFGKTLLGIQLEDNMRGVDLLQSRTNVDPERIGATGASGGGNQTMYLTALDERIKAGVSVVSCGTFESNIMGSNCICETIFNGMNICEESAVLALVAPRAFMAANGLRDEYSTFTPREMLRSCREAEKIFRLAGARGNLVSKIFDLPHGYWPEIMEYTLGFFDLHLKGQGHGESVQLPQFTPMSREEAQVFETGKRPPEVPGILGYCQTLGKKAARDRSKFRGKEKIRFALRTILNCQPQKYKSHVVHGTEGGWRKISLETESGSLIPLLLKNGSGGSWRILSSRYGKQELAGTQLLQDAFTGRDGVIIFDCSASGERGREYADPTHWDFHNTSRSYLWLGRTMLGEWVNDYLAVTDFARKEFGAEKIIYGGNRDTGIAALTAVAIYGGAEKVIMENSIRSFDWSGYQPDCAAFSLVLSVPDILKTADISTLVTLASPASVEWITPILPDGKEYN